MMPARAALLTCLLTTATLAWQGAPGVAPKLRFIRSISGPSGKLIGSKFVIEENRNRFVYPQDGSLVIYMQWESPPGDHRLTGLWKAPDGRTASISSDIRMQTATTELQAYWSFELASGMTPGVWTLDVRVDGEPGGSHSFEVVMPAPPPVPPTPNASAVPAPLALDEIYKATRDSLVWVHRLDANGRRVDSGHGFVIAKDRIATAFQCVDSAERLEVEFADGRRVAVNALSAWSRLEDWAILPAPTTTGHALSRGESAQLLVGERLIVYNVENENVRVIGGVDLAGRRSDAVFGDRLQLSPAPAMEAVGGPLFTQHGKVVGVIGGSTRPGARFTRTALSVSPSLFMKMASTSAATPLERVVVDNGASDRTFAELRASGVLTPPIQPTRAFTYGGTSNEFPKTRDQQLPSDISDFSSKDQQIWLYSIWQRHDKISKGVVSARVFDASNRSRVEIAPKKVSLAAATPIRIGTGFSPASFQPGTYRIDVLFNDVPVWRTFFTITD